jgi:hypothetical protein
VQIEPITRSINFTVRWIAETVASNNIFSNMP